MRRRRTSEGSDRDAKVARLASVIERQARDLAGSEARSRPAGGGDEGADVIEVLERAVLAQRELLAVQARANRRGAEDRSPGAMGVSRSDERSDAAIDRLIRVRDRIDSMPGPDAPAAVVDWIDRQLASTLVDLGVQVIEDDGAVDDHHHEVVQTIPSDDRADQIAATARVGYRRGDTVLRPQQVTAYEPREDE